MEDNLPEKCVKLVLLGDSSVGKTSLAVRFRHEEYGRQYYPTAGADFFLKRTVLQNNRLTSLAVRFCHEEYGRQYYPTAGADFFLKRTVLQSNRLVRAVVWDLSGQVFDSPMFQKYLFDAEAILLTFDITNLSSFMRLKDWLSAASSLVYGKPPLIALLANKGDMEHQRAVSLDKQLRFVNEHGIQSTYTVSARTGENVMLAFQRILAELLGLRLSRVDQEEQLSVVKAEIVAANHNQAYMGLQTPPSTICNLQ